MTTQHGELVRQEGGGDARWCDDCKLWHAALYACPTYSLELARQVADEQEIFLNGGQKPSRHGSGAAMTERNMQQVIEGWREIVDSAGCYEAEACRLHMELAAEGHGRTKRDVGRCADEASAIRKRLVGLVREWRQHGAALSAAYERSGRRDTTSLIHGGRFVACADALEQILGPLEGENGN